MVYSRTLVTNSAQDPIQDEHTAHHLTLASPPNGADKSSATPQQKTYNLCPHENVFSWEQENSKFQTDLFS